MDSLPFAAGSLDAIWAEGAIYNIGFEAGVRAWSGFLKSGGILAVSDLTWLTHRRPDELDDYWRGAYPEVAVASRRIALLEAAGFTPIGYFPLPKVCWLENFYRPLQTAFEPFLARQGASREAIAVVDAERAEIALYERFSDYVSYGFYIARKL